MRTVPSAVKRRGAIDLLAGPVELGTCIDRFGECRMIRINASVDMADYAPLPIIPCFTNMNDDVGVMVAQVPTLNQFALLTRTKRDVRLEIHRSWFSSAAIEPMCRAAHHRVATDTADDAVMTLSHSRSPLRRSGTPIVTDNRFIELTADIVSAHVANNPVAAADVPALIKSVYGALASTAEPLVTEAPRAEPAVAIRASIKPDYLVCLEDGAKLKMLKRYLRTNFDLSPDQYRAKWHLPADYPMVAPNYAATRRDLAVRIGLGRKRGTVAPTSDAAGSTAPKPAPRKRLAVSIGDKTPPATAEIVEG